MKKWITMFATIFSLALIHWLISYGFEWSFFDSIIPFGFIALLIIFLFTNKSGAIGRQIDLQIQRSTLIKVENSKRVNEVSFVMVGSVVYFVMALLVSFYVYKDYFIN
ncbi:hypothetical protein MHB48_14995 [Psychrobacillus sp. FSL H8-0483]|uniref:hypothetical protein n=1 Tax=Psychrobacillus sp. FSL H8-0483 TaxID=2921389 RepID=UPI003159C96D